MMDLKTANRIAETKRGVGATTKGFYETSTDYLFLITNDDPFEGQFDPFVKVNKQTGDVSDFSPVDYENSLEILAHLTNKKGG
jgi:hypothetical protein